MSLSLVGTATASATTVTPPAHQPGDLIVIFAFNGGATTVPSLPSGWLSVLTKSGTTCSARLGYKIATSTSDASGTWTNADELVCHVYRPSSGNTAGIGVSASAASTTNTVNYPALALVDPSGNSWVAGFAGCNNTAETIQTAPAGMTGESHVTGASYQAAGADTEGGVTSWSSTNATTTGTATDSVSCTVELLLLTKSSTVSNLYQHVGGAGTSPGNGNVDTGDGYTMPLINPSGAGNTIVLAITYPTGTGYANGSLPTITDSNGNTWPTTAAAHAAGGAGNMDTAVWVLQNCKAGQTTIKATFGTNIKGFTYSVSEFYGVATSGGANGSSATAFTAGTTLSAGSFTPATSNNIIWAHFCEAVNGAPAGVVQSVRAIAPFTFLDSGVDWSSNEVAAASVPRATICYSQSSGAVDPSVMMRGDTTDQFNAVAVALAISNGAGTPPSGSNIRIANILHFGTTTFPSSGLYNLQAPFTGNLRVLATTDPNINALTVTDSEGNTWTKDATAATGFWYLANAQPNPNLTIYTLGGGADNQISFRLWDIVNANSSPYDSSIASGMSVGTAFTQSPSPDPANANGVVIANIGLGQGPGLSVTSPAGASWDLRLFTGETDLDPGDNADISAHYYNSASGSETWSFTCKNATSTSGGVICFKAAPAAAAVYVPPRRRALTIPREITLRH